MNLDLKEVNCDLLVLYNDEARYKTSPDGEEKGQQIHRVPAFIFKSNNVEYARIVESPKNDLVTDVAQIALGFPSKPNYEGANYLFKLFDTRLLNAYRKTLISITKSLEQRRTTVRN